jgi:hypothetical protein
MSDSWQISYNAGGSTVSADVSFRNVLGDAVKSITRSNGQTPCAGIFRFTFESSDSVSVLPVGAEDVKSPNLFSGARTIVPDGSTQNNDLIEGLSLLIGPGIMVGTIFEVGIGCYWDAGSNLWRRITSLGLAVGGLTGADRYGLAKNISDQDMSNSRLVVTNGARIVNSVTDTNPIQAFCQTGLLNPLADSDLLGREISFANYTGATVDILLDGQPIDVYDITDGWLYPYGHGIYCDGVTVYRFADGTDLQSCTFILNSSLSVDGTCQIFVSDGGSMVEIYDPYTGEYVPGTTGIYLTGDNVGLGVVISGESADFRLRLSPASDAGTDLNQRIFSLRVNSQGV